MKPYQKMGEQTFLENKHCSPLNLPPYLKPHCKCSTELLLSLGTTTTSEVIEISGSAFISKSKSLAALPWHWVISSLWILHRQHNVQSVLSKHNHQTLHTQYNFIAQIDYLTIFLVAKPTSIGNAARGCIPSAEKRLALHTNFNM